MDNDHIKSNGVEELIISLDKKLISLKKLDHALGDAVQYTEHASDIGDELLICQDIICDRIKSVRKEIIKIKEMKRRNEG
jgi:hypothetical protein